MIGQEIQKIILVGADMVERAWVVKEEGRLTRTKDMHVLGSPVVLEASPEAAQLNPADLSMACDFLLGHKLLMFQSVT